MITIGDKEITAAYVGKRALSAVYAGARLVWSAISSCFGLGYWKATSRGTGRTHGTVAVKLINE